MNDKITRKDYEIKTLKQVYSPIVPTLFILFSFQELHHALDTISEQSHQVKLLEFQPKVIPSFSFHLTTEFHLGC